MQIPVKFFKTLNPPPDPSEPNAIYLVYDEANDRSEIWVTDMDGVPFPSANADAVADIMTSSMALKADLVSGKVPASQIDLGRRISYLDTEQTRTNTTVLTNTPLSITLDAGGIYAIDGTLFVNSSSLAEGGLLKFDLNGGTVVPAFARFSVTTPVEDVVQIMNFTTLEQSIVQGIPGWDIYPTIIRGAIAVATAGTLIIRAAQAAAEGDPIRIMSGSYLAAHRLN